MNKIALLVTGSTENMSEDEYNRRVENRRKMNADYDREIAKAEQRRKKHLRADPFYYGHGRKNNIAMAKRGRNRCRFVR